MQENCIKKVPLQLASRALELSPSQVGILSASLQYFLLTGDVPGGVQPKLGGALRRVAPF